MGVDVQQRQVVTRPASAANLADVQSLADRYGEPAETCELMVWHGAVLRCEPSRADGWARRLFGTPGAEHFNAVTIEFGNAH